MKRYWPGALTGMLTGLAIGYLTAPESGKKIRKNLGDALNEHTGGFMHDVKNQWTKTVSLAGEVLTNVKTEIVIFTDKPQNTVDSYKKDVGAAEPKTAVKDNDKVDELADGVKVDVTKAKDALTIT